ncbi:MAG: hypothetical protein WC565_09835 [Parcubacteria group bacterium]
MKKRLALLFVLVAAVLLGGCNLQPDPLVLTFIYGGGRYGDTISMRPSIEVGGLQLQARLIGGGGPGYSLDWGDGSPKEVANRDGIFHHLYTKAGTFHVVGSTEKDRVEGLVTVENSAPVVYGAFYFNNYFSWREKTTFDLRYLQHGCDAGTGQPLSVTGVKDPDGDPYELLFEVVGDDGSGFQTSYSVFLANGDNVTGEWFMADAVYVFMGYTGATPIIPPPLGPMGCGPVDPDPGDVPEGYPVAIRLVARDYWGSVGQRLWAGVIAGGEGCE